MDFTDKRILVTGGSRGIGRAAVEVFLAGGARVAVNGRSAESTAAGIAALGDASLGNGALIATAWYSSLAIIAVATLGSWMWLQASGTAAVPFSMQVARSGEVGEMLEDAQRPSTRSRREVVGASTANGR